MLLEEANRPEGHLLNKNNNPNVTLKDGFQGSVRDALAHKIKHKRVLRDQQRTMINDIKNQLFTDGGKKQNLPNKMRIVRPDFDKEDIKLIKHNIKKHEEVLKEQDAKARFLSSTSGSGNTNTFNRVYSSKGDIKSYHPDPKLVPQLSSDELRMQVISNLDKQQQTFQNNKHEHDTRVKQLYDKDIKQRNQTIQLNKEKLAEDARHISKANNSLNAQEQAEREKIKQHLRERQKRKYYETGIKGTSSHVSGLQYKSNEARRTPEQQRAREALLKAVIEWQEQHSNAKPTPSILAQIKNQVQRQRAQEQGL